MFKALSSPVLILAGVGLLWLGLSWVTQPAPARYALLQDIAAAEDLASLPPTALPQQATWLVEARLGRLRSLAGLLGLVAALGLCIGWSRRQVDALRGYRFAVWTAGLLCVLVLVVGGGFALVCPWPLPLSFMRLAGVSGLVGLTAFLLAAGLPHIT